LTDRGPSALERCQLDAMVAYREAYKGWLADRAHPDTQRRIDVQAQLQTAERQLLEIARRDR